MAEKIALKRMAVVFDEWLRRYADDPTTFGEVLGEDGRPVEGYGDRCAVFFDRLTAELDATGALPH